MSQDEKKLLNFDQLKSLKIRYLWLISQTETPNMVGFELNSPEYVLFRFTNLIEIILLIDEDKKYLSRGTFLKGNGCISLINVCECLYEETKQLYAYQIEQLKKSECFEEV